MDTLAFLSLVLPESGLKFLASPNTHGGFHHTVFDSVEEMAETSAEWDAQANETYFALGGFLQPYIMGTDKHGNPARKMRVQENVGWLRALWVDLDVGEPPKKYPSQQEAIADLVRFTRAAGLPLPLIVNSGGGIHAYWPLDADVPRASWKTMATMLKQVAASHGLLADPARTADEASVLRVVGTHNHKRAEPRPVKFVGGATGQFAVIEFAKLLAAAFKACGATMPKPSAAPVTGANADLIGGLVQHEPSYGDRIIARCPQVAAIAAARGAVEEPLWYASLQLARHCQDGRALGHAWSDGHPDYSAQATDRKLDQLTQKNVGPTTCARFNDLNAGVCPGCPHFGKITSPIQLGKDDDPVPAETPTVQLSGIEVALPDAPEPYTRTAAGQIAMLQYDEDGNPAEPVLVYRYDLYPISRYFDEFGRKYHTKFRTYQPKRGWYDFDVPNEVLYDGKQLAKTLANSDVLPDQGSVKYLGDYIVSYVQKLQEMMESNNLFTQMGWRDDDTKFVVGTQCITATDVTEISASTISAKATEKFKTAGTMDAWKEVVGHYSRKGNEALLFGFLTAFGAPLFKFTGFNGAILNMMGPSGTGKSTVLRAVNSVYGAPDCAYFQLMDTEKSFYRRVGVLNHLPIAFDEITNIDPKRLSDLCYDFTQGRERMRLTSNATERTDTFTWQTIMLSSANASLHNRLAQGKSDASAESVRVFEYNVGPGENGDALELKRVFDQLRDNYGHAGAIYLQRVMAQLDEVRARLTRLTDTIYTEAKLPSSERFWAAIIAANLTGGHIAKELGLVQYDETAMIRWAIGKIHEMRGVVQENTRSPVDVVSDWLAKLTPNTLVVCSDSKNMFAPSTFILPKNELKARYDKPAGKIFIPVSVVQELCRTERLDHNALRRDLTAMGVLLDQERKVLGAGTEFQTGQTRCWVVNSRSPLMTEKADEVSERAEAAGVVTEFRGRR